jgi:peptidoglycan/xylan/chitin deacetylase (PgdA/CDA1 family)
MMEAYQADRSWRGKLRRRWVRLASRRPACAPAGPMLTFAFDDAPLSAAEAGAAILEARGLRGSFFICAGLAGQDGPSGRYAGAEVVKRLAEAGHEIGCHTYSHLDCGQADAATAVEDVARNAEALAAWGAPLPVTFAWPYGDVAPGPKRALAGRFALLRGLHQGLITAGTDLNQAPAVGVEGPHGEALARRWLARAWRRRQAWLILFTHDVDEAASPWGCTPGALARLADEALALGFEVVTAAEGAGRLAP